MYGGKLYRARIILGETIEIPIQLVSLQFKAQDLELIPIVLGLSLITANSVIAVLMVACKTKTDNLLAVDALFDISHGSESSTG